MVLSLSTFSNYERRFMKLVLAQGNNSTYIQCFTWGICLLDSWVVTGHYINRFSDQIRKSVTWRWTVKWTVWTISISYYVIKSQSASLGIPDFAVIQFKSTYKKKQILLRQWHSPNIKGRISRTTKTRISSLIWLIVHLILCATTHHRLLITTTLLMATS